MSLLFRKNHEASESSEQNYDFYLYINFGKLSKWPVGRSSVKQIEYIYLIKYILKRYYYGVVWTTNKQSISQRLKV